MSLQGLSHAEPFANPNGTASALFMQKWQDAIQTIASQGDLITAQAALIAALTTRADDIEDILTANGLTLLSDHENRIVALEP